MGDVLLIDVVKGKARGKAMDLEDARPILKYNYHIKGSDDIGKRDQRIGKAYLSL